MLIDGATAESRRDQKIDVRGNRIAAVYTLGAHPLPSGAELIDLGAATVLPGLIDAHT
jgi:imidazolonepropionase-like amidohydrolase